DAPAGCRRHKRSRHPRSRSKTIQSQPSSHRGKSRRRSLPHGAASCRFATRPPSRDGRATRCSCFQSTNETPRLLGQSGWCRVSSRLTVRLVATAAGVAADAVTDKLVVGAKDALRLGAPEVAVAGNPLGFAETVIQIHPFAAQAAAALSRLDGEWLFR